MVLVEPKDTEKTQIKGFLMNTKESEEGHWHILQRTNPGAVGI